MTETFVTVEGVHPTTVSCLEAMQALAGSRHFAKVLDMGCGGGVLSVMAAHWWPAEVVAVDISPQAVADTQALAQAQGMAAHIQVMRSDGFSEPGIAKTGPYDLIVFNMLAEPLCRMAPEVRAQLAPGGVCITSGILSWLEPQVVAAYEGLGFRLLQRISRGVWRTLVWELNKMIITKDFC